MAAKLFYNNIYNNQNSSSPFKSYLEQSTENMFTLNLKDSNLIEIVTICAETKSKIHSNYRKSIGSLLFNLQEIEKQFQVTMVPIQVTDIFWGYFISFCQSRGLKMSSIETLCNQLRSILNWAVKYNAKVSPTYTDIRIQKPRNQEIALTQDDVSRITYFDIDRFYSDRRKDFRETMTRIRDHFVLSCNLYQRYSDMVRVERSCFDRNIFKITQQKTGALAVVNIDKYSIDAKTTYRILEKYDYNAPYNSGIGNYNFYLHILMKDIGFDEPVRLEERVNGKLISTTVPKWKMISSHTARRTAITIGVIRGHNIHALRKCSGHSDLRIFDEYVRDE